MAIRCCNGIPAAIWRAGTRAISCPEPLQRCSGLYLHYGESFGFWINLAVQSLATLWLLQLSRFACSMMQTFRFVAISLGLMLSTALPWLASMLLTDIFAGLFGAAKHSC